MTNYLITGSTGFVGKSVTSYLMSLGHQVKCISREELADGRLYSGFFSDRPILIHTAWAGVLGKHRNSNQQKINEDITAQVVKLAIATNVKALIAFGSQAEYGNPNVRVSESYPLNPNTLYGKLKIKCHQILQEHLDQTDVKLCWLRLYDPYGPGDNIAWFMPYVIRCALRGESPELTECTQLWDYIYIDDVCRSLQMLSTSPIPKDCTYNLSSDQPIRLRDVVDMIYTLIKPSDARPLYGKIPFRNDQVLYLQGNNEKLKAATGWLPLTNISQGIKKSVNYWKSYNNNDEVRRSAT